MTPHPLCFRVALALCGLGFLVHGLPAQEQLSGKAELADAFRNDSSRRLELTAGTKQPTAADKNLVDVAAKWYIHRVTWTTIRSSPVDLARMVDELENQLIRPCLGAQAVKNQANKAYVDMLGQALVRAARPLFQQDIVSGPTRPDAGPMLLHGALMLPVMARLKQEDIGDYLVELIKDSTKNDAIRLYAMRALREYFPAKIFTPADIGFPVEEKKAARDAARIDAVVDFVEGRTGLKPAEVDADVIRYLRRDALETLGLARLPAVSALPRGARVEGALAPTLLKALTKTGMTPEPALPEKIEAAIGLCHMKFGGIDDYRPELAVYLVGRFLVEFTKEYNKEWVFLQGQNRKPASIPWRLHAKRIDLAVKDLVLNAKPLPDALPAQVQIQQNAKIVEAFANQQMQRILGRTGFERIDPGDVANFQTQLTQMRRALVVNGTTRVSAFRTLKSPEIDIE